MKIENIEPASVAGAANSTEIITDKRGFGKRWGFSIRHVDNLLAQGLPHLKIGKRRVRIFIADADAWMKERFACRRIGKTGAV